MKTRSHFLLALVAVALAVIEAPAAGPQASEFPMAAVPPASVNRPGLPSGGRFEAVREPQGDVKAYPPLRSEKPLYGGFTCGSDRFGRRHFDFVIDESGDTGAGYDRLYVDVNGNRDLRDDRPVSGSREVPNQPKEGGTSPVRFEVFAVPWDYGEGIGVRPFRMQAVLYPRREGDARLVVGGETVRLGRFTAAGRTFEALLSQSPAFSVRYDLPETALLLSPIGADGRRRQDDWQGCHELRQRRPIGDTWYSFGATPLGDKLIVRPYGGDFGVLRTGTGGRDLKGRVLVLGSVENAEAMAPVGNYDRRPHEPGSFADAMQVFGVSEYRLPVGDYSTAYLTVTFGAMGVAVGSNIHAEGQPGGTPSGIYRIAIRKDKPFVLDFSDKPVVMFVSPPKGGQPKPGGGVEVRTALVVPGLGLMVRSLFYRGELEPGDTDSTAPKPPLLVPKVIITDPAGKVVAEDTAGFG